MGSGKTTLGKKLARSLNRPFIDTDAAIEAQQELNVNEIFERYGEPHFRQLETEWIHKLSTEVPAIIATGGGMPCFNDNLNHLKSKGLVIYLKRPAKELFNRLKNAKTSRPLLASMTDEEMLQFVEEKLSQRDLFYLDADLIMNREEQEVQALLGIIAAHL